MSSNNPACGRFKPKIIAPVGGGPQHDTIARWGESRCGRDEIADRQGWTVRIDQADAPVSGLQERRCRMEQAFAQGWRNRLHQANAVGQMRPEEGRGTGWRVGHPTADIGKLRGGQNVVCGITQEHRVESCCLLLRQGRHQARLGPSGDRGLGHGRDGAGRPQVPMGTRSCQDLQLVGAPSIWLSLTTALVVERSGPDASVNSRKADRWPLHIGLIPACGPEELLRFASVAGYTRRSISRGMGLRCSDLAKSRVMAPSQDPRAEPTAER